MRFLVAFAAMIVVSSCATKLTGVVDNRAPILVKTITDVSTKVNTPITITLRHVEANDQDGDKMSLVLGSGTNYTVLGTTVTPATGFIGDLFVPVTISDGKLQSQSKILIVSVVSSVELLPLITGSWWEYRDSVLANDSVFTSRLTATWSRDSIIDSKTVRIFNLEWTNLADLKIKYESYTDVLGTTLLGGTSPSDTLVNPQRLYRYPIKLGDSWKYQTLNYNVTDTAFYMGDSATITCTDTLQYVTVPAGIFECVEMTLTYKASNSRSISGVTVLPMGIRTRATGTLVEKLYYSPGVGYVKNVTTMNGSPVWVKELTNYHVEEEK